MCIRDSGAGVLIGLLFTALQNGLGIIKLPEDIYFTPYLPMDIFLSDVVTILAISVGMVLVSSMVAARRALVISPLEAVYLEK